MRIYLAGPMRGLPEFNFPAFHAAAKTLRELGHEVFNPAERDEADFGKVSVPSGDENELADKLSIHALALRRKCFGADTAWICTFAEAIALLPGWKKSKGAQAEKALGEALGLTILYLGKGD